ncbi:MAG: monovalent cation/H+ antiporter subunit D family protein [Deltaproteobacteria bacterium]|nr:MAG: monovalent cation/H+ antiporter subunit D family protein [Deltaproteobacteria bacterium]
MSGIHSIKPILPVLITLTTVFLIMASRRRPNLREFWSIAGSVGTFVAVLTMVPTVLQGEVLCFELSRIAPGLSFRFRVDGLGMVFGLISSFLWILASFYNIGYMRSLGEHAQTRYYACFSSAILGAQGVAYSGSLLTLYLFYEIITVVTYPLVAHHQDEEAYEAGKKYLFYLMGTSKGLLLPAMVLTYLLSGTLDFSPSIQEGILNQEGFWVTLTYWLFILGFAKAAIMPLHNWLPSAMVAPTPVSALLHAVAVVKAGVFSIARVMLSVFGLSLLERLGLGMWTAYFVSITIILASVIALTKDDLKERLAYSTISQLSYIVLGVALLSTMGITGGIFHIVGHALGKITLFFCAGAIYVAHHKKRISELSGIGYAMPFTMGAFALASLSMIGIPPVGGFVSKWFLVHGAMDVREMGIVIVLLVSALLNAGYFAPITFRAFFEGTERTFRLREAPLWMVIPLCATALLSLFVGFWPDLFVELVRSMR